jgi:hypothetical protein
MGSWIDEVDHILKADDVHELADQVRPYLRQVTIPNDRGRDVFEIIFNGCLEEHTPERAMWIAWLIGAAWQLMHLYDPKEDKPV